MSLRVRSLYALALATLVATPLAAQKPDPLRMCTVLPPKLGGLDACREAVRSDPTNAAALGMLATAYVAAGDDGKAIATFQRLITLRPDSADAQLELARVLDRKGDLKGALASYEAYRRLRADEPRASYYVGMILLGLRRYDEALAHFRRASELDSLEGRYYNAAGVALTMGSRHEEAYVAFQRSVRLRPEDAQMWGAAARSAHTLGRSADAVYNWDHAVNLQPGYFDRRKAERKQWERAIREIGPQRMAVINRPVQIEAEVSARRSMGDGKVASFTGSGFWVSNQGYLLTNRHVVKGCREIKVRPDSGTSVDALVVATDPRDDLALLKTASAYPSVASFRDGAPLRRGEDVVAVGFPLNGLLADQVNVTVGTVSALAGIYNDTHVLQMTAPVQQGNSGGPLFDASGNVIGVVVTKLNARAMAAEIGDYPQNVNFAIKSDVARRFLDINRVQYRTALSREHRTNPDIGDMGRVVTVLVECFQ